MPSDLASHDACPGAADQHVTAPACGDTCEALPAACSWARLLAEDCQWARMEAARTSCRWWPLPVGLNSHLRFRIGIARRSPLNEYSTSTFHMYQFPTAWEAGVMMQISGQASSWRALCRGAVACRDGLHVCLWLGKLSGGSGGCARMQAHAETGSMRGAGQKIER